MVSGKNDVRVLPWASLVTQRLAFATGLIMLRNMRFKNAMGLMFVLMVVLPASKALAAEPEAQLPAVTLYSLDESTNAKKRVSWKYTIKPIWEINSEGAQEYFWGIGLDLPAPDALASVQAQDAVIGFTSGGAVSKDGKVPLFIKMTSLEDLFIASFANGSRVKFGISLKFQKPVMSAQGCEEFGLFVKPQVLDEKKKSVSPMVPGYMAIRCDTTTNGYTLAVTVPKEVEWKSSTIFESKGKGKRWKSFDLTIQTQVTGRSDVGNFVFGQSDKEFLYSVFVDRLEAARKIARFRLSLALLNLSVQTKTAQDALMKPAAHVIFEVRPWWPQFAIGGQGISSLPSVNKGNYFTHTEAVGYLGYSFGMEKTFTWEPRLYMYMADGISQALQFFYTVNIPAMGGAVRYKFSQKNSIEVEVFGMSTTTESVMSARAVWTRELTGGTSWGFVGSYNKLGVNLKSVNEGYATQTMVGPFLAF